MAWNGHLIQLGQHVRVEKGFQFVWFTLSCGYMGDI